MLNGGPFNVSFQIEMSECAEVLVAVCVCLRDVYTHLGKQAQ